MFSFRPLAPYGQDVENLWLSRSLGPYVFSFLSVFLPDSFFLIQIRFPPPCLPLYSSVLSLQIRIIGSITRTGITELKDMWIYFFDKSYQIFFLEVLTNYTPTENVYECIFSHALTNTRFSRRHLKNFCYGLICISLYRHKIMHFKNMFIGPFYFFCELPGHLRFLKAPGVIIICSQAWKPWAL